MENSIAAYRDIEGAFNNVELESIHKVIYASGISTILTEWIDGMQDNRFKLGRDLHYENCQQRDLLKKRVLIKLCWV